MSQTTIYSAYARLNDQAALTTLLAPINDAHELQSILRRAKSPCLIQGYDPETRIARYVAFDGKIVACYSVTDISLRQAAEIAAVCDDIPLFSATAITTATASVLGCTIAMVQ